MTLQRRLLILLSLVLVFFMAMISSFLALEQHRAQEIWRGEQTTHEEIFSRLLELKGESLRTLSFDYTYWDDMVNFIRTPDETWAADNLETALGTFRANVIWIFDLEKNLVYAVNDSDPKVELSFPLAARTIDELFARTPLRHFFAQTPFGVVEIRGATVHETSDVERTGARYGYFFTGRLWDDAYLQEVSALADADVLLGRPHDPPAWTDLNEILIKQTLHDASGAPLYELRARWVSPLVENSQSASRHILVVSIVFSALILICVMTFLLRWVSRPLRAISTALREENTDAIQNLGAETGELGDVARLIRRFFEQKEALVREIKEREKVEKDLWAARAQLIQADKMSSIGQLASGVAHKINNPIGYIISNFGILKSYIKGLTELVEAFEKLEQAAAQSSDPRLRALVENLSAQKQRVDLANIKKDLNDLIRESLEGADKIKDIVFRLRTFAYRDMGNKAYFDLNDLLETALRLSWNELKYKAEVHKEYGQISKTFCNHQEITEAFLNIMLNAAQAIDKKGEIRIKSRQSGDRIIIEISDTGCGIAPENIGKVFDPFFTTKPIGTGTGLGLSLAQNFVKNHHGNIRVKSEFGKGSTFIIDLPVTKPA